MKGVLKNDRKRHGVSKIMDGNFSSCTNAEEKSNTDEKVLHYYFLIFAPFKSYNHSFDFLVKSSF